MFSNGTCIVSQSVTEANGAGGPDDLKKQTRHPLDLRNEVDTVMRKDDDISMVSHAKKEDRTHHLQAMVTVRLSPVAPRQSGKCVTCVANQHRLGFEPHVVSTHQLPQGHSTALSVPRSLASFVA